MRSVFAKIRKKNKLLYVHQECPLRAVKRITCQIGHPVQQTFLVSIHVNAAGSGLMWHNATG